MRSSSRVAAWVVGLTVAATILTLGCSSGEESGLQLNDVVFGEGTFVTVAESPDVYVNTGPGWNPVPSGVGSLEAVTFDPIDSIFVAVGDGGAIVTSFDFGATWTQQSSGTPVNLHDVAAGDGWLVAVGDGGVILRSFDAVTWTQVPSGTDASLYGVGFGVDASFLAVGAFGTILGSTDAGQTWIPQSSGVGNDLYAAAFGDGRWVVSGFSGTLLVSVVQDAWLTAGISILPNLNNVLFAQGLFTVVGDEGTILISPNGGEYSASASNTGQFLYGAAYGNGQFVVVGSGGHVFTSRDGAVYQEGKI